MNAHDYDLGRGLATPWALRYEPLRRDESIFVFPCDEWGNVPLHELGRDTLLDYLFARRMVGRTLARPRVVQRQATSNSPAAPMPPPMHIVTTT